MRNAAPDLLRLARLGLEHERLAASLATPERVYCVFAWEDFAHARLLGLARTLDAAKAVAGREEPRGVRWEQRAGTVYGHVPWIAHQMYFIEHRDVEGDADAR
jgi:hypothetical protein